MRVSSGAIPQRLSWSGRDSRAPVVSLSKHRLVYLDDRDGADLWPRYLRTGDSQMIIGGNYSQGFPRYSPVDQRIAFQSDRSGTEDSGRANPAGKAARRSGPLEDFKAGRLAGLRTDVGWRLIPRMRVQPSFM